MICCKLTHVGDTLKLYTVGEKLVYCTKMLLVT